MYPNISYDDGLQAVVALSVYCYNNGKTYMTYTGNPAVGAAQTELRNSDNQLIGSVTYIDGRKGSLSLQYALASDETSATVELKPSYIVSFRGRFYVCGAVTPTIAKNNVVKFSVAVVELQSPFIPILLTTATGQQLATTHAASSSYTVACAATGTRTGAVLTYSGELFSTPGSALPSGITISSTTGVLTVNAIAGTYDLRIIVQDVVTLPDGTTDTVYGWGRYTVVLS